MATLSELLKELHTLPLGNIYRKRINGESYYYHQYFSHGKRYSTLLKNDEIDELRKKINRRKELETLIREKELKLVTLSKNADELTGYVMNENTIVASFIQGILVDIDEGLAPFIIKRTRSIVEFLQLRTMDMSRTNARILKKVLNINVDEEYKTPLFAYALSISDHYWFKPKHSKLKYQNVRLNDDSMFETSLKGETNVFYQKARLSPEITTTGSFEKGWRYINNEWWLYKSGNNKQYFSELFCSRFAKLIGVRTVRYEMDNGYIRCPNFSKDYNYEPIASLADSNEDYSYIFNILYNFNKKLAKDYLKIIFFDSVINNVDRHNENLGFLRDVRSGIIVSLAPNFDNNLALIATTDYLNDNPTKDGFIKFFINFLNKNDKARDLFTKIKWKDITKEDIDKIINDIDINIDNIDNLSSTVYIRYEYLKNLFNKQHK